LSNGCPRLRCFTNSNSPDRRPGSPAKRSLFAGVEMPSPAYLCTCGTGTPACAPSAITRVAQPPSAVAFSSFDFRPNETRNYRTTNSLRCNKKICDPLPAPRPEIWRAPAGGKIIEPILKASVSEAGRVGRGGKESSPGGGGTRDLPATPTKNLRPLCLLCINTQPLSS